jgi:hypothetical protein
VLPLHWVLALALALALAHCCQLGKDDVRFAVIAVEYHSINKALNLAPPIASRGIHIAIVVSSLSCAMRIAVANGRVVLAGRHPNIDDA